MLWRNGKILSVNQLAFCYHVIWQQRLSTRCYYKKRSKLRNIHKKPRNTHALIFPNVIHPFDHFQGQVQAQKPPRLFHLLCGGAPSTVVFPFGKSLAICPSIHPPPWRRLCIDWGTSSAPPRLLVYTFWTTLQTPPGSFRGVWPQPRGIPDNGCELFW